MTTQTILVIEHEDGAPAGWLGHWLTEAGATLDVRRPYAGDALPSTVADHDALLVLGGGMDAWDDAGHPWLPGTRALVLDADRRGTATLGICLGFQLAVLAMEGQVGRNPAGAAVAVLPVGWDEPAAKADPLFAAVLGADSAAHWNRDIALALPSGSAVLARTADGAPQAVRLSGSVWGVQCHPEASPAILRRWVDDDGAPYRAAGFDIDGLLAAADRQEAALAASWRPLGETFLALARRLADESARRLADESAPGLPAST